MSEDEKKRGVSSGHQCPPEYVTFQVANSPLPPPPHQQPPIGVPQPVPPPEATAPPQHYAHGCQAVPGYAVAEGRPIRESRLPCCGIGIGWVLFIIGFFLAVPWYVGAVILLCARIDHREKPGYIACTVAAILATLAVILRLTVLRDDDG